MNSREDIDAFSPRRNPVTPLTIFLCLIMVFFCAVLVFVYAATKRANPVMLDQNGHPLTQSSGKAK